MQQNQIYSRVNDHSSLKSIQLTLDSFSGVNQQQKQKITYRKKWGPQENRIYLQMLKMFPIDFSGEQNRRRSRIFKRMSQKMGGKRDSEQCRGHHKKMMEKFQSVPKIIQQIQRVIDVMLERNLKKLKRKQNKQKRLEKKLQKSVQTQSPKQTIYENQSETYRKALAQFMGESVSQQSIMIFQG